MPTSILTLTFLFILLFFPIIYARGNSEEIQWTTTPTIRVTMKSTADWARVMFDDTNGTNTNGIRFKKILKYAWITGNDDNDRIDVAQDLTWLDILYNETVTRTGDIVAFFKLNEDFDYTEMYADVIFEVDSSKSQVYIYLMIAGRGTTTFQLTNQQTGDIIWKTTLSGDGRTQHIKTYLATDSFLRTSNVGSSTIISMAMITLLMILTFNIPQIINRQRKG